MTTAAVLVLLLGIILYSCLCRLLFKRVFRIALAKRTLRMHVALWLAQLAGGLLLALVLVALTLLLPLLMGHYAIGAGGGPDEITFAARLMQIDAPMPPATFLGYVTYYALGEELLFRGILMLLLALLLGGLAKALVSAQVVRSRFFLIMLWLNAIAISSLAFSMLHAGNPNVGSVALTNIFLVGVLLSFLVLFTRGITLAAGAHIGWNALLELVNLPVSGFNFPTAGHPFSVVMVEDGLLTGGEFGPEASICLTAVLLIIIAACLYILPRVLRAHVDAMPPLAPAEPRAAGGTESDSED